MIDVQNGLGLKYMPDLVRKEIEGIYATNILQKSKITKKQEVTKKMQIVLKLSMLFLFFLSGFSTTTIHESQNRRERGRAFL